MWDVIPTIRDTYDKAVESRGGTGNAMDRRAGLHGILAGGSYFGGLGAGYGALTAATKNGHTPLTNGLAALTAGLMLSGVGNNIAYNHFANKAEEIRRKEHPDIYNEDGVLILPDGSLELEGGIQRKGAIKKAVVGTVKEHLKGILSQPEVVS